MDASDPPPFAPGTAGAGRERRSTEDDETEDDLINRIRTRAHQIWEEEGHPTGRSEIHWRMAAEQLVSEDRQQRDKGR